MKKTITAISLLLISTNLLAETEYPKNPILRPLTLTDGTIAITGAVALQEEKNENRGRIFANLAYGLTDNLTLGYGGLNYRILARPDNQTGLELAVGLGLRGHQEQLNNKESIAYGTDITGKYVFAPDLAMTFALGFVKWDEQHRDNREEFRYSVGVQKRLASDWSINGNYTYRDLKDFEQNNAHQAQVALNYTYNKNTDIGLFAGYSNFDAQENGYKSDHNFDRAVGLYVSYRF